MNHKYVIGGLSLILALLLLSFLPTTAQGTVKANNPNITIAINDTAQYIQQVNMSAYLVFYPNLTQAYSYLDQAKNASGKSPSYAQLLLTKASESAMQQQSILSSEKSDAIIVVAVLLFVSAVSLFMAMSPRKKAKMTSKKRRLSV